MGKFDKELRRARNQVVDAVKAVEPAIRHAVKEIEPAIRHAVQKDGKETKDTQEPRSTHQTSQEQVASVVKEEPPMPEEKGAQEPAQPLVEQGQLGINNVEFDDAVKAVLCAEAAAVDGAAPPHFGVEQPGSADAVEALPPPPDYVEAAVIHMEPKQQAEDPRDVRIRQLEEQLAVLQAQAGSQIVMTPVPVVTLLRDSRDSIQNPNNVPTPQVVGQVNVGQRPF